MDGFANENASNEQMRLHARADGFETEDVIVELNNDDDFIVGLDDDVEVNHSNLPFENLYEVGDFDSLSDEEYVESALVAAGFSGGRMPNRVEIPILEGKTFATWEEFKHALYDYEAISGWTFERIKKTPTEARAICRGRAKHGEDHCRVELSARIMKKSGLITIRKVYLNHTCSLGIHKWRNGAHRTKWVARQLQPHVEINPNTPMKKLNENLRSFHEASSVTWTLQRARAMCREKITGGARELFQKIPTYLQAILAADANAHASYQTGPEQRFARLYIAPGSSRVVFSHCRPLVGLDGTHTTGQFPMILLFATCFDGENHIVILAWALVPVENTEHWTWFMENLRKSFEKMKQPDNVFISDRDKGLLHAVADIFPESKHAHCVEHLRTNVKGNIDAQCSKYFKQLVHAPTKAEFERLLTEFRPQTERQKKFIPYIRKLNEFSYARHAFPGRRWGHTTSNVVEIINGAVKPARVKPTLMLCGYLWNYAMEKHYERSEHAKKLPTGEFALTEYANNLYTYLYGLSRSIKEKKSSDTESLMFDAKGSWVVRIHERYCGCSDWQELDFPCAHAIRFFSERGVDARQFVGKVWLARSQLEAYAVPIPALSIDRLVESTEKCLEPFTSGKKRANKGAKRAPGWCEQLARQSQRLVVAQSHKCSRCKLPGHNKRSCSNAPPPCASAPVQANALPTAGAATHDTLVVGNDHSAMRTSTLEEFQLFHTRASTENQTHGIGNYREWYESQAPESQVTQQS